MASMLGKACTTLMRMGENSSPYLLIQHADLINRYCPKFYNKHHFKRPNNIELTASSKRIFNFAINCHLDKDSVLKNQTELRVGKELLKTSIAVQHITDESEKELSLFLLAHLEYLFDETQASIETLEQLVKVSENSNWGEDAYFCHLMRKLDPTKINTSCLSSLTFSDPLYSEIVNLTQKST